MYAEIRHWQENHWSGQLTEHKGAVTPLTEHREVVTTATEHKAPFVPPREVHLARLERVKIPAPPIVGRQGILDAIKKGPPPRPADEQKHKVEAKDTRKGKGNPRNN